MKPRKDRYAVLQKERMPWGKYAGRRIADLSVNYCKFALTSVDRMNPLLRELLKLRIEKETNWLKDLQERLAEYEALAEKNEAHIRRLETQNAKHRHQLESMRREGWGGAAPPLQACLRALRRRFAARYHPDATDGSTAAMALINQIFNELENEVRSNAAQKGKVTEG